MAITTKAIENVINNPEKLNAFKAFKGRKDKTIDEYIKIFALRAFTLAKLNKDNRKRFSHFLDICSETTADFGYLCDIIASDAEFANIDFKVNPILELYEELLKENWEQIKNDRETLNAIDAFTKTPESNTKICKSIVEFLKQYVLTKENDLTIKP